MAWASGNTGAEIAEWRNGKILHSPITAEKVLLEEVESKIKALSQLTWFRINLWIFLETSKYSQARSRLMN